MEKVQAYIARATEPCTTPRINAQSIQQRIKSMSKLLSIVATGATLLVLYAFVAPAILGLAAKLQQIASALPGGGS